MSKTDDGNLLCLKPNTYEKRHYQSTIENVFRNAQSNSDSIIQIKKQHPSDLLGSHNRRTHKCRKNPIHLWQMKLQILQALRFNL